MTPQPPRTKKTPKAQAASRQAAAASRPVPSVLLTPAMFCLVLSGAGSLTLEIVWSRWLRLVFGSTTIAVTTTLVAYMLGLGLGGLVGARWARRAANGLRLYGLAELTLGIYALLMPLLLAAYPAIDRALSGPAGGSFAGVGRFVAALAVLMLPTLLMGASLPLVTRALEDSAPRGSGLVGLVYGVNTLGAVLGVLVSTFVLLPQIGVRWTNTAGAALDVIAGAVAYFVLAPRLGAAPRAVATADAAAPGSVLPRTVGGRLLLASYALVGGAALADEVAWTRALALIASSSVYAFAVMLVAFLTGLFVGSLLARRWSDRLADPLVAYGWCAIGAGVLSIGTLLSFRWLPDFMLALLPVLGLSGKSVVGAGLIVSLVAMLGPTLVFGALFPLAARAVTPDVASRSAAVGAISFVNTVGSALGALAAGFWLVPLLGLARTMTAAAAALIALGAVVLLTRSGVWRVAGGVAALLAVVVASVPPSWNQQRITAGDYYHLNTMLDVGLASEELEGEAKPEILYYKDGLNATVTVQKIGPALNLRNNGKIDASLRDMATQLGLGHIPLLFGPRAEKIMVIGYASGVSVGAMTLYDPQRIDVVEIEPAVIEASHFFDAVNHNPLANPRVHLTLDDARHVLNVTREKYDVIMSEPSNPFLSGAASLFTSEFFRTAHRALTPQGRLFQWVQLYGLEPPAVESILAAITAEFAHVYGFTDESGTADLLLYASDRPLTRADIARWASLPEPVRRDLQRLRIDGDADIWSMLRLTDEIKDLARGARVVNTDDSMFVELGSLWTLYADPSVNRKLVAPFTDGVRPLLDAGPERASSEDLGQLALSYDTLRRERAITNQLTAEAERRGTSPAQLAAAANLLYRSEDVAQHAAAAELLDRAVLLGPGDFDARLIRAFAGYRARQYDAALADVNVALQDRPQHLRARRLRLRILGAMNRVQEADAEARALLASPLVEIDPRLYVDAAVLSDALGNPRLAAQQLSEALALNPFEVEDWKRLATFQRRAGDEAAAARAERNAARAARNQIIDRHRTARLAWAHGDKAGARRVLNMLITEHPDYAPARADLDRYGP